jgi:hypothetical protein
VDWSFAGQTAVEEDAKRRLAEHRPQADRFIDHAVNPADRTVAEQLKPHGRRVEVDGANDLIDAAPTPLAIHKGDTLEHENRL